MRSGGAAILSGGTLDPESAPLELSEGLKTMLEDGKKSFNSSKPKHMQKKT